MLQISNSQFQAIQKEPGKRFEARAAGYLRHTYPDARFTSDEHVLARFISAAVDKAKVYDIRREIDVIRFFHVIVGIGGNPEVLPDFAWVVDYLREPIRAELRLDYIFERLRFESRESR
jgi:hypothetical protein